MPDYDVIIVGARIAGAVTATLLGERGWRVLVADRATFPSDTLSTHFFRSPALDAFRRAGVYDEVQAVGAPHLVNYFNDVDGHVFTEPAEEGEGAYVLCIRRLVLDDLLVRRVRGEPTVTLWEGAMVRSLLRQDGRVVGITLTHRGADVEVSARVVVGADGAHSLVARHLAPATERAEPVRRAMYYGYFAGLTPQEPPAAEFHYRGNELVYVFPCDAGLALVAVSVPIAEFPGWKRDGRRLFVERLAARPTLVPRLRQAEWVGTLFGAGDIPCYVRVPYGPGWALVGDAGLIMDPWSGRGIEQGSAHAVLLADALHRWLAGEVVWEEAMGDFHRARNVFAEKPYRRTCANAADFRPMTRAALARRGLVPAT
ncbi:MAG: NAD(P)/FAD-dependent oxidoreductase [Candidatus Rokuibacteriota bacterium]